MKVSLDPRTKMVLAACISTLAVVYNSPGILLALLAATILIAVIFRIKLNFPWSYFWKMAPLFLMLFLVQCLFRNEGAVLLTVGTWPLVTEGGLNHGLSMVLRIIVIIVSALLLASAGSRDIVMGLVQWRVPYEIAFMFSVALHFLPLFREEFINLVTAVQLRGVEFKKVPWRQKLALCRQLLFPAVYGAVLKAGQMAAAMEARGFRAYPRRTYLRKLRFGRMDYVCLVLFPFCTVLCIVLISKMQ